MKILYGVCGDGMGHVMRSAVVARHLEARGHRVSFVSSLGAAKYLEERWPGRVMSVRGLSMVMTRNGVVPGLTVMKNLLEQAQALPMHTAMMGALMLMAPKVVISDFEPVSAQYATFSGTPLVAVDNIHFINRCTHPPEIAGRDVEAASMMKPVVDYMVRYAKRYLITTFVNAPVCKPQTTLHLPILRHEILRAKGRPVGEHVVGYFNAHADHLALAHVLSQLPGVEFRVYGKKGLVSAERRGNVTLLPFSDAAFVEDLATARAVVGSAGFTLVSEAIYLGKPMLAMPFAMQFEQILNANYLERLGYGARVDELTVEALQNFLSRVRFYTVQLREFVHDGNQELLAAVDAAVEPQA